VALRFVVAVRVATPELNRMLRAKKQAEALGGTLCAWGASELAIAFEPEDVEEVIAFASGASNVEGGACSVGIARGELAAVHGATALAELSWGPALIDASAVAGSTPSGAVYVEESAAAVLEERLADGRLGPTVLGERRPLSTSGAALFIRPLAEVPLVQEPPQRRATGLSELPPSLEAGEAADKVVDAIRQGDLAALERHLEELRAGGASNALISRLSGLAALGRGATIDALRTLRGGADAATDPATRTRAHLALAVALGAAGRSDEALLAALRALSAARGAADRFGERACARFLAQLSAASGFTDASLLWDRVALRAAGSMTDDGSGS
jgi:hypothetical protein